MYRAAPGPAGDLHGAVLGKREQTRAGRLWPRGQIPADYEQPVRSAVPALISSGNMDPVSWFCIIFLQHGMTG